MDSKDKALIRVLHKEEIFKDPSPFKKAAELLGWDVEEVLARAKDLKNSGVIRRFGAALTPAKAGFTANAMVAWEVEKEREEEAADSMAAHPRVSHCYIRPAFDGFPYKLYTMIHGNSLEDLNRIIDELSKVSRAASFRALHSTREFKKSSPVYFP
ncbi:MAG: Lrp/AsnC family transcriptional regulator [Deltaproteobacteria bacterium]|nr:Lrp/AsnC family transcriptional regulator [Deltaproteobacteria bacterium]